MSTWVDADLCDCAKHVNAFEVSRFHSIIGASNTTDGMKYAIKLKFESGYQLISSTEAIEKWPHQILNFLESRLEFAMPPRSVHFALSVETNIATITGPPAMILGNFWPL